MATKTPNYQLELPEITEGYDVAVSNRNATAIDKQMKTNETGIDAITKILPKKVDVVDGKGLSTNDFTAGYKKKVDDTATTLAEKADLVNGKLKENQLPVSVVPIVPTAGTGSAYTATVDSLTSLFKGLLLMMVPHVVSNSVNPTLNVGGFGAKPISRPTSAKTTTGNAGYSTDWITAGVPLLLQYDGAGWAAIGQAKPVAEDLNGTVAVPHGGTGKTSWTACRLIYAATGQDLAQIDFPAANGSFLRQDATGTPYWATPEQALAAIGAASKEHVAEAITAAGGVHGLRYYNNVLAFYNAGTGTWVEIETGGGGGVAPGKVTDFSAGVGNGSLKLLWKDPGDTAWVGTKIMRKAGSYPNGPKDGVVVVDCKTRNAYAATPFVDSGLSNGTTYYYQAFPYSESGDFNTDVLNRTAGTPKAYSTYGIRIDMNNDNPLSAVTYTDDAVGMTGGADQWDGMTIFKDVRPCLLKAGTVQYYLNKNNFAQRENGAAATITDPNAGDVMIEIPKTGMKITTSGQYLDIKITDSESRGGEGFHYYSHTRASEGDRNKLYLGAYLGSLNGSTLCSLSGQSPANNATFATFIQYAKNRGNGYDIMGFYPLMLVQAMYLVKYKSLNSQQAVGRGYVDGNPAATSTGQTNAKGMCFGETTGKQQMKLFGLEDFWGNVRQWIGGMFCDASRNILTAFTNFNDNGNGYTNRGQGAAANVSGWLKKVQGTTETGFVAKEVGGSETTFWSDCASLGAGCLPYFGGAWSYGGGAGAFYLYVNYSASSAYASLGARLMYL